MRNATGESANRFHLLGLTHLGFEPNPGRHITQDGEVQEDSRRIAKGDRETFGLSTCSSRTNELDSTPPPFPVADLRVEGGECIPIGRSYPFKDRSPQHCVSAINLEEGQPGRINLEDLPPGTEQENRLGRVIDNRIETVFAFAQRQLQRQNLHPQPVVLPPQS